VPSRRQTRLTAVDILTLALADRQENRFCHMKSESDPFKTILENITVFLRTINIIFAVMNLL
jgi:hypothetical protein